MAAKSRRSDASLVDALRDEPERFEFIQAVRLLERAAKRMPLDGREVVPGLVGLDNDPRTETVRLRAALELAFPATEVAEFDDSRQKPELAVTLLGLIGVSGVLPGHYSRLVLEAVRDNNDALRDFLDLFNHRALSLFVRAAEKYRLPLSFESARAKGGDSISGALLGLIGMRGAALQNRQAIGDEALLFYAGHFSRRVRTADALRQMLSDHFDQPVGIKQFQGHWADLQRSEQTQIGAGAAGYGALGVSAVVGARVWDMQGSFRVTLGPLDYSQFMRFLPGAADMEQLAALTRTYVGPALGFDVQLTLKGSEVPPLVLSSDPQVGGRLGWNTWLPTTPARGAADDAVLQATV